MSSRLINVRLDEERSRKAKALRASGTNISELVRDTIDERYAKLAANKQPLDVTKIMKRLFEEYPDPPNMPPRDYDLRDRRQVQAAITRHLRNKRRET